MFAKYYTIKILSCLSFQILIPKTIFILISTCDTNQESNFFPFFRCCIVAQCIYHTLADISIHGSRQTTNIKKQECIPVGCVPSTAVAVSGVGGVCLEGSCLPRVGVCPKGWSLPRGGVCPKGWSLPRGLSAGGCTPPPDRILDTRL